MPPAANIPVWRRLFSLDALAPERVLPRSQWLEVILIPLIAIGLGWLSHPQDPLLANAAFPWLWFAPALVALRYGVFVGLVSGALIFCDWLAADTLGLIAQDFPRDFFFGGGLLVLLCGEFSDVWRDRNARMEESNLYVIERLSRLTKRHLLLNLSHDRLEQEMLARPGSLRDALARLRTVVIGDAAPGQLPGVDGLLQLLAEYGSIEATALYVCREEHGKFQLGQIAGSLGEPQPLMEDDELLRLALEKRSLVHIADAEISLERRSNQLVVAPLIASDDTIVGVLAVTQLPFFSLSVENLQMVAVILAYYADHVRVAEDIAPILRRLPTMPVMFAEELARMLRMQRKIGISSHIVTMVFNGPRKDNIPADFLRIKRGLDLYWQTFVNNSPVIAVLMPFASVAASEGFLRRIDGWLTSRYGGNFASLCIDVHVIDFSSRDPLETLAGIIPQ